MVRKTKFLNLYRFFSFFCVCVAIRLNTKNHLRSHNIISTDCFYLYVMLDLYVDQISLISFVHSYFFVRYITYFLENVKYVVCLIDKSMHICLFFSIYILLHFQTQEIVSLHFWKITFSICSNLNMYMYKGQNNLFSKASKPQLRICYGKCPHIHESLLKITSFLLPT